jgi:hypothetical protein
MDRTGRSLGPSRGVESFTVPPITVSTDSGVPFNGDDHAESLDEGGGDMFAKLAASNIFQGGSCELEVYSLKTGSLQRVCDRPCKAVHLPTQTDRPPTHSDPSTNAVFVVGKKKCQAVYLQT